jgi:hypothetical protein
MMIMNIIRKRDNTPRYQEMTLQQDKLSLDTQKTSFIITKMNNSHINVFITATITSETRIIMKDIKISITMKVETVIKETLEP